MCVSLTPSAQWRIRKKFVVEFYQIQEICQYRNIMTVPARRGNLGQKCQVKSDMLSFAERVINHNSQDT